MADSIKKHGVLQPLIVSERTDGGYELIAGEMRILNRVALKAESCSCYQKNKKCSVPYSASLRVN